VKDLASYKMADPVTTSNTQETETSAAPNSLPLGANEAETSTGPNTLPPREHDAAGEEVGTKPMPDNPHEPQKSQQATDLLPLNERKAKNDDSNTTKGEDHPEGQQAPTATTAETQAGASSGSGNAAQEPETSTTGDGTGVKESSKDPQTVAKAPTDELELQEGLGKDPLSTADEATATSHSATKDRAGSTSEPPTNIPATNPATGPSAAEVIDRTKSNQDLVDAAKYGDADAVKNALLRHANIVAPNDGGETALHLAARYGNIDALTAILEEYKTKKLDINIRDDDGWTPLYGAAGSASKEVVSMILDMQGVDLKAKTSSGQTPLYAACYSGNFDVVERILGTKVGPDTIEMANEDGCSLFTGRIRCGPTSSQTFC
jgi:Ankyrin repeats (3 copies)